MTARPKLAAFKPAAAAPVATAARPGAGGAELVQTSFRITRAQWQALHEAAVAERVPVKSIMIEALSEYFAARGLKFDV